MRILHAGNANFGYVMSKELRKKGIESDVLVSEQSVSMKDRSMHNPLTHDKNIGSSLPEWFHTYDLKSAGWKFQILKTMRKYDIIHAYMEMPIFAMFSLKPYVAQSGGDDLRDLAFQKTLKGFLMRRAYQRANAFVYVWPPHKKYAEKLGLRDAKYIERAWDASLFDQKKVVKSNENRLTIFHPVGQEWEMKGNDKFLRTFVKLCKEEKDVFLYYVNWGPDSDKAKKILDVPQVKKRMKIIPGPISRDEMIAYMQKSDILAEQFNSGSFTRTGIEGFFFGIPLLINLDEEVHEELHGESPPVINAKNEHQIYDRLNELTKSKEILKEIGEKSTRWAKKYYSLDNVIEKYLQVYYKVLGE